VQEYKVQQGQLEIMVQQDCKVQLVPQERMVQQEQ
jgi:hypothetical protein